MKPQTEEAKCDAAIARLYGSTAIIRFGRKDRKSPNTGGVPDRLYLCGRRLVWYEVKNGRDILSVAQIDFLTRVLATGAVAGCGGLNELLQLLNAPKPYLVGHAQIEHFRTTQGRKA